MEEIWAEIEGHLQATLNSIGEDVVKLFKQAIQTEIYDYYEPTAYERTDMFINSVTFRYNWEDSALLVFSDINTGYYSAVDGSDQSENITNWLEDGHSDGIGSSEEKKNQYHQFEGRHFLEEAERLIKKKYPFLEVEIFNEGEEY